MDDNLKMNKYDRDAAAEWYMPEGWSLMGEEYELTEEDKESGLADSLYEARGVAATAIGNLFSKLGIDEEYYQYLADIPIGLEDGDDALGKNSPGQYGIILGRKEALSDPVATIAHEMIHSIQSVPPEDEYSPFRTTGGKFGWGIGLEEGMAEALSLISIKMQRTGDDLEKAAREIEEACAEEGTTPATQMSARLAYKLSPATLGWYLTCGQTGAYKEGDKIREIFGPRLFLNDMDYLYRYECGSAHDERRKNLTVEAVTKMIDQKAR